MELRSSHNQCDSGEYKELQKALHGMGFYEANMELQEMRQLMSALHASMYQKGATDVQENDVELALKENEFDFVPPNGVCNSTMITSMNPNDNDQASSLLPNRNFYQRSSSSPFSSPEVRPVKVVTEADVHHENDWSPPWVRLRPPTPIALDLRAEHRKRQAIHLETIADDNESSFDSNEKRIRMQESNLTSEERQLTDSGVSSNFSSTRTNTNESFDESGAVFSNEETNSEVESIDDRNVDFVNDCNYTFRVTHNDHDYDDDDDDDGLSEPSL